MVLNKTNEAEKTKPILACMERGPGPGKYYLPGTCGIQSHDPTKYTKPSYSFGTKKNHNHIYRSPGPVYFIPPNLTRNGLDGTPKYTITGRKRSSTIPTYPGPDAYRTEDVKPMKTSRPPCYSFGSRTRYIKLPSNPSPNSYTLPSMIGSAVTSKNSAATFVMTGRSTVGSFHQDFKNTPGPGTYKIPNSSLTKVKVPMYTLKGRNYPPLSKGDVPGPGTYRPEKVYVTKVMRPSYTFGIRHSDYLASFETM